MSVFLIFLIIGLALLLITSLLFVLLAPSYADAVLATQLVGTIGVAILAILSFYKSSPFLLDVALALAMLTSITLVTFTRLRGRLK